MKDWLKDTAEKQKNIHGIDLDGMTTAERITYIKDMAYALEDEVHEATSEIGWKPWASSRHINREAYIGECVDIGHFLANMLVAVKCTDAEWDAAYTEKATRNAKRQADGYTGLDKCRRCNRAFDDIAAKTGAKLSRKLTSADVKKIVPTMKGPETVCIPCASAA